MNSIFLARTALAVCALAAGTALADEAASAPARGVGVSDSTAARAQAKAASGMGTATLVRTGPGATRDARRAASGVEGSASSAMHHRVHHATRAASTASE